MKRLSEENLSISKRLEHQCAFAEHTKQLGALVNDVDASYTSAQSHKEGLRKFNRHAIQTLKVHQVARGGALGWAGSGPRTAA